jgi:O-antigen biosynthesis protein
LSTGAARAGAVRFALQTRKAWQLARNDGTGELVRRVVRTVQDSVGSSPTPFPLAAGDVADSSSIAHWPLPAPKPAGTPLVVGWVCTPPGLGSGGHTTMMRYIEALEAAGHHCVLYLYDRHGSDLRPAEHVIRTWWPRVAAEVRDVRDGLRGLDTVVATSWPTAHVVATRPDDAGHRFYLVQDFEPYFYGRGAEYVLAEDTYRFGFHCLTVGPMLAELLGSNYDARCEALEFGCDRSLYGLLNEERRRDVVFYGKPDAPRRGFGLGVLAMEAFHRRHPEVSIHTFGVKVPLPFPAQRHGHLPPTELNKLYNSCAAGLSLSFTNVSLIPYELLACGAVPVVNEDRYSRAVLQHPDVHWSNLTPEALADGLSRAVEGHTMPPAAIASALGDLSWERSADTLVRVVEDMCRAPVEGVV